MIKLFYCQCQNFGDAMNPILIERLTGKKCHRTSCGTAQLCGIGSILGKLTQFKFPRSIINPFMHEINVWSSGFIQNLQSKDENFQHRKVNVLALRGKLTQERVENILNQKLSVPLGDGGLLFNYLLDKHSERKYSVGIIPHVNDFHLPIFQELHEKLEHSTIIDLSNDPIDVLRQISSCDFVLSSAMHGLIAADALGIPNKWLEVSNNVVGNGYKFLDYYSVFNLKNIKPLHLDSLVNFSFKNIETYADSYQIEKNKVEHIQKQLYFALKKWSDTL